MTAEQHAGLVCKGLSDRRGFRVLFHELNCEVAPGELLEVTGSNGAGKSTLLHCLTGLRRPEQGVVSWNGQPVREGPRFREDLRYIGHRVGVKLSLTVRENVRLGASLAGADAVEFDSTLQHFALSACVDVPCARLSAGQRRRVALARLAISPGRLWILDEPYSALDSAGQKLVSDLLKSFCAEGGTVVMTTHHAVSIDGLRSRRLAL